MLFTKNPHAPQKSQKLLSIATYQVGDLPPLWLVITLAIKNELYQQWLNKSAIKNALMKYSGWWKIPFLFIFFRIQPLHIHVMVKNPPKRIKKRNQRKLGLIPVISNPVPIPRIMSHGKSSKNAPTVSCFRIIHHDEYINLHQSSSIYLGK